MEKYCRYAASTCRAFHRGTDGAVALIFGLAFIPLMLAAGAALDYSRASTMQSELKRRADSAALAAAKAATDYYQANCGGEDDGGGDDKGKCRANAIKAGSDSAQRFFSNIALPVGDLKTKVEIGQGKDGWSATASFSGRVSTAVMKIARVEAMPISGSASAAIGFTGKSNLNFYLLLDNSSSMGIAATQADMTLMRTVTSGKMLFGFTDVTSCVFACHEPGYSSVYYDVPKSRGVRFRIDDLRDATLGLVNLAKATAGQSNVGDIRMGAYAFSNTVNTLANIDASLNDVSDAVTKLDLPTVSDGTQIADAIDWLGNNVLKSGGKGSSKSPVEIVFLVTDGVEGGARTGWRSRNYPTGSIFGIPNVTGTISETACDNLKKKGATVAVVYTTYVPFPGDQRFDNMVTPFIDLIQPRLEACASPGYFFVASNPGDIGSGMQTLFRKAIDAAVLRLTH